MQTIYRGRRWCSLGQQMDLFLASDTSIIAKATKGPFDKSDFLDAEEVQLLKNVVE